MAAPVAALPADMGAAIPGDVLAIAQQIADLRHDMAWSHYRIEMALYNNRAQAQTDKQWSLARTLNASVNLRRDASALVPLDLPAATLPLLVAPPPPAPGAAAIRPPPVPELVLDVGAPHAKFPATVRALRRLRIAQVNALCTAYGIPLAGTVNARRIRFARFIGVGLE
ncbi:hypothetical protein MKEN_00252100 [Mycena kentingensis (nom. inval.)]|nr:hypothetical protein MKEN_00252100 [Mycena kentingensis (nom. inval.)]